jgi:hypothetical protein
MTAGLDLLATPIAADNADPTGETNLAEAIDDVLTAAGFPSARAGDVDVASELVAHVRALAAERDQLREALAVVRVKATTLERQPQAVLQWIGRYCAIASIPPAATPQPDGQPTEATPSSSDDEPGSASREDRQP